MHAQNFILWKDQPRSSRIASIMKFISGLAINRAWEITVKPHQRKRSVSQNAYLWSTVYPSILTAGGETLAGWTVQDLHEFFLSEHFGSEVLRFGGRDFERPVKRSSKLTTIEFSGYVAFIQQKMAEIGVFVPDPDPLYYLHREPRAA